MDLSVFFFSLVLMFVGWNQDAVHLSVNYEVVVRD